MAEASIDENPPIANPFFCHKCSSEISHVREDYTCPTCFGGFIEELDNPQASVDGGDSSDEDMEEFPSLDMLNQMGEILFGLGNEREGGGGRDDRSLRALAGTRWGNNDRRRTRANRNMGGPNNRQHNTMEHVIQDFILNLTGLGWGPMGTRGDGPVFFLGNPGDYAWGREGLDAIVTQLLNQMDAAGPPPLDKEKISEIPTTLITQQQREENLQCSVCWEDFIVGESVRKLDCDHYYHEPCIIPWLELHGTCPICRKSLSSEEENKDAGTSGGLGGRQTWSRFLYSPQGSSSSTSTSTSSSTGPSSSVNCSHGTCPICRKSLSSEEENKDAGTSGGLGGRQTWSRFLYSPQGSSSSTSTSTSSSTGPSSSSTSSRRNPSDDHIDLDFD